MTIDQDKKTTVYEACAQNDPVLLKHLLLSGMDLNEKNSGLIVACRNGNIKIIELLIKFRVNLEAKETITGNTGLIWACQNGHVQCVQLLIKFGANLEATSYVGHNAFIVACERGHFQIVNLLIQLEINMELKDKKYGYTGFIFACRWGFLKIVNLLINSGKINLEAKGKNGYNGLICACQNGHLEVVDLLIQSGIRIDSKNPELQNCFSKIAETILISPLYFERKSNILFFLLEHGLNMKLFEKIGEPKNEKQNKIYEKLKQKFQTKIHKNKLMKDSLKNLFIDVEMVVIDTICDFSDGQMNLKNCL